MHIHIVPNRKSTPTVLLRESVRTGNKVGKRTLANLSSLSMEQVEGIRAVLNGQVLRPVSELFEVTASKATGHIEAVFAATQRLGLDTLIDRKPCRERCRPAEDASRGSMRRSYRPPLQTQEHRRDAQTGS